MSKSFTKPKLNTCAGDMSARWYVSCRYTSPLTDERKTYKFYGEINRISNKRERIKDGNALAKSIEKLLNDGWDPSQKNDTFIVKNRNLKESLTDVFEIKHIQLSREAKRTYKYVYNHFTSWLASTSRSSWKPEAFRQKDAQAYLDDLSKAGKSGRNFNNYRTIVKVFFNMLVEREIIQKNPFQFTKPAKTSTAKILPFNDDQVKTLREHLEGENYGLYTLTQFIYYTHIRPIEATRLQIKHFHFDKMKIEVPGELSKNNKVRWCEIPGPLLSILEKHVSGIDKNWFLFGHGIKPSEKQYSNRNQFTVKHAEILKELGFEEGYTLYSWKHTGMIAAYKAGIPLVDIQRQAGHHDISMTMEYFQNVGLVVDTKYKEIVW